MFETFCISIILLLPLYGTGVRGVITELLGYSGVGLYSGGFMGLGAGRLSYWGL